MQETIEEILLEISDHTTEGAQWRKKNILRYSTKNSKNLYKLLKAAFDNDGSSVSKKLANSGVTVFYINMSENWLDIEFKFHNV